MVLLSSALGNFKIGATEPIFLDSGSPRGGAGGGVCACMGMVCYHCIVHILNSSKKTLFSLSLTVICAELCCQTTSRHILLLCAKLINIRALEF